MSVRYVAYGLVLLAAYWFTARSGYVFFQDDGRASPPAVRAVGPTFWGTGYQGGK
jgi:hypothetical protein